MLNPCLDVSHTICKRMFGVDLTLNYSQQACVRLFFLRAEAGPEAPALPQAAAGYETIQSRALSHNASNVPEHSMQDRGTQGGMIAEAVQGLFQLGHVHLLLEIHDGFVACGHDQGHHTACG